MWQTDTVQQKLQIIHRVNQKVVLKFVTGVRDDVQRQSTDQTVLFFIWNKT